MPAPDSIDDLVAELAARLSELAAMELSGRLVTEPPVAVGQTSIVLRAQIFASAETLEALEPMVRCKQVQSLDGLVLKPRPDHVGEYTRRLPAGSVDEDATYRLTLHPTIDRPAIAAYTLHTFSEAVVTAARRQLDETLSPGGSHDQRPAPDVPRGRVKRPGGKTRKQRRGTPRGRSRKR